MSFIHLHNHSHFSILEWLPKPVDYVKKAKELWMEAVALTDTWNLHWGHEFYKICKSEWIKPIMWVEIFVKSSIDPKLKHKLVLIAKSLKWYQNIIELLTKSNLSVDEENDGMSLDDIREIKEKLSGQTQGTAPTENSRGESCVHSDLEIICLSWPITWEIPFYILSGKSDEEILDRIKIYQEIFGEENFYLELLDHRDIPKQDTVTNKLIDLNKKYNIPVVACQNTYYINQDDKETQDVIQALWTGHEIENPDRPSLINWDYSFKSEEEMQMLFGFIPEAIENTQKISDMCDIEFETGWILIPVFELPEKDQEIYDKVKDLEKTNNKIQKLDSAEWYLRYLSFKWLNWRFDYGLDDETIFEFIKKLPWDKLKQSLQETLPDELKALSLTYYTDKKKTLLQKLTKDQQDHIERLEYELVVIHEMWFDGYFLIVADYINWARDNNIPVGPWRWSAAGSLMAYLSWITDIDPVKFGLIFERFLNPARISMPDIDTDFADVDRSRVIEYCREKYWDEKVVQICTFGTFAARAAAQPFVTKHNDFGNDVVLRIAPEISLKMATVWRYEKVFEFAKNFRNEWSDPSHMQEFSVVEHYAAWWNFEDNIKFTENMMDYIFDKLNLDKKVKIKDKEWVEKIVDFTTPWDRIDYSKWVTEATWIDISKYNEDNAEELRSEIKAKWHTWEWMENQATATLIDYLYKKVLRPNLVWPAFIYNYPKLMQPLARQSDENPNFVEQFQVVLNGWEIMKSYSELVDPKIQQENFDAQSGAIEMWDEEATSGDDDFVLAMEYWMPCQSGWAVGFDRIISLLTGQENLRDVVLFPLMKS